MMEAQQPNFVVLEPKPDFKVLESAPKAVDFDVLSAFDQLVEFVKEKEVTDVSEQLPFDQPVEVGDSQATIQQVVPLQPVKEYVPVYQRPNKRRWFWWR